MSSDQEKWNNLLKALDEKGQLGLITFLKKAIKYEFKDDILFLTVNNQQEAEFLSRASVQQQIMLIAEGCVRIKEIKIS